MSLINPTNKKNLEYRLGVGMMIVDSNKKVFIGRRIDSGSWQMPQGGIDSGELPSQAAMREMQEEVGSNNGLILAESKFWYSYDIPSYLISRLWDGQYMGQKQKWFLIKYLGTNKEINIRGSSQPEFNRWRWINIWMIPKIIVSFKRSLYLSVLKEFEPFLKEI